MPRFVRKFIPYMTNEKLLEEFENTKGVQISLLKNDKNLPDKAKFRLFKYHENNRVLLASEIVRRCINKEGIFWVDKYMLVEDAKEKLMHDIQHKEAELVGLDDRQAHIVQVSWESSLTYMRAQLDKLNADYP